MNLRGIIMQVKNNGYVAYRADVPSNPQLHGQIFDVEEKYVQRYFEVGESVMVDRSHPYHGGRSGMVTKVGTRATRDNQCVWFSTTDAQDMEEIKVERDFLKLHIGDTSGLLELRIRESEGR